MADEERNDQNEEREDEERDEQENGGDEASASSGDDTGSGSDGDGDDGDSDGDDGDGDDGGDAEASSGSDDDEGEDGSDDDDDDEGDSGDGGGTKVSDVMASDPASVEPGDSIEDAAQKMKENDVGALLVVDGDELKGIVTDRDVSNAVAEGKGDGSVEDVASTDTTTIDPDSSLEDAIKLMRDNKVRRLPVVDDDGKPVGIVSLGDLAIEADDDSALKEISEAEPNA